MDHITQSTSENCDDGTLQELDFVNHWVNSTIESEVLRGSRLQKQKPKPCSPYEECSIVTIENVKSPCAANNFYKKPRRRSKVKADSPSPRSNNNCPPKSYGSYAYFSLTCPHNKPRCLPRCPLRIAELAVPSKRQCIDTWRNKCELLPPIMVERLRQHVMDEKPIVQITDAISCFKRRKPKAPKKNKPKNYQFIMKKDRMEELKKLCEIFGNKIAQKLITRQTLKLNPELNNISKIVAEEIANLMKNRKYNLNNLSESMRKEMSEKIATWISSVLEDTTYKLLEDDLRVNRQIDRTINEDGLITLVTLTQTRKTSELEEEEGPVLNFIDELMDRVMDEVEPQREFGETQVSSSVASGEESPDYLQNNESMTSLLKTINLNESPDVNINEQDIQKEIHKIIDYIISCNIEQETDIILKDINCFDNNIEVKSEMNNDLYEESKQSDDEPVQIAHSIPIEAIKLGTSTNPNIETSDKQDRDNIEEISKLPSLEHIPLESKSSNTSKTSIFRKSNDINLVTTEDNAMESKNSTNNEDENDGRKPNSNNVSDEFKIFDEESSDEKNKKVTFTKMTSDQRDAITQEINGKRIDSSPNELSTKKPAVFSKSNQNIEFSKPNDNLLSDADEKWPDDLTVPVLKLSASVNRSVTSLGKIIENEERHHKNSDTDNSIETEILSESDRKLNDREIVKNIKVPTTVSGQETAPTEKVLSADTNIRYKTADLQAQGYLDHDGKETHNQGEIAGQTINKIDGTNLDGIRSPNIDTIKILNQDDTIKKENIIMEKEKQKGLKTKFEYRVKPDMVPSWLQRFHGKGEPSEDSFADQCRPRDKTKQEDILKWCKDLDRTFANLQMWNMWLESTCNAMMYLRKKSTFNKLLSSHTKYTDAKNLNFLQKNIEKDICLWKKQNHSIIKSLKITRMKVLSTRPMTCNCKNNFRFTKKL